MTVSGVASAASSFPVLPRSTGASPSPGATAASGAAASDRVALSGLGGALRGDGLTAFGALSDAQRQQLADLVDSGKISGETVNDALTQRLKQARVSAMGATQRMYNNDHADLFFDEATSVDDLRGALSQTLARRSSLMDKLTAAMSEDERASASTDLAARTMNPLLAKDRMGMSRYIMPGFFSMDFSDSRLNSTKKQGDATYSLKALGVDLDAIDKALRKTGEEDAAAILSERAGLPASRKVAADQGYSVDDALVKPLNALPGASPPDARDYSNPLDYGRKLREFLQASFAEMRKVGELGGHTVYQVDRPPDPIQRSRDLPTPSSAGAAIAQGEPVDRAYMIGLAARY
ncbi:hypothetical protein [Azospirillum argentinense]|uniref:hypothetical protein n=1 Tax=Azospirillum argentinense TaxID=2970906 RepID=UPI0032E04144